MEVCGEPTRHHLTWCVHPAKHSGPHGGVYAIGWADRQHRQFVTVLWPQDGADPIVTGAR